MEDMEKERRERKREEEGEKVCSDVPTCKGSYSFRARPHSHDLIHITWIAPNIIILIHRILIYKSRERKYSAVSSF